MREIKFRVYCEFEFAGELHKSMESPASWFLLTQTGKLWTHDPGESPRPLEKNYKKAIPLFYTGLKDKNGKEIYEGDVVRGFTHHDGDEFTSEVFWDDCGFCVRVKKDYKPYMGEIGMTLEIIGNIHENPELLEEK